jgi:hypothetical protein
MNAAQTGFMNIKTFVIILDVLHSALNKCWRTLVHTLAMMNDAIRCSCR